MPRASTIVVFIVFERDLRTLTLGTRLYWFITKESRIVTLWTKLDVKLVLFSEFP